jgi:hypothetical protein
MARRTLLYQLQQTFFGLTPQYRKNIFDQIHEIVFHGKGGYSFSEVYEFPIHLRKYIYHTLTEYYEKQNKQQDGNDLADKVKSGAIQVPDFMRGKKLAYNGG